MAEPAYIPPAPPEELDALIRSRLGGIAYSLRTCADDIERIADRGPKDSLRDLRPQWSEQVAQAFSEIRSLVGNFTGMDRLITLAAEYDVSVREERPGA